MAGKEKIAKILEITDEYFTLDKEKEPMKITNAFRKGNFKVNDSIKYEFTNVLKIIGKVESNDVKYQNKTNERNSTNKKLEKENDNIENKIYIEKNRKLDLKKDYYPYNFVSLGEESKAKRTEFTKGNLSGKIKCSLKNLTPLFIGGNKDPEYTLTELVEENGNKSRKYIIPASTIKGELRNIIEVLTRSCMKNIETERLTYRYQMKKNGRTNIFGVIKKLPSGQNYGTIAGADIIRIERKLAVSIIKNLKKIAGNSNAKNPEGFYEIFVNKNKVDTYKSDPTSYSYDKKIDNEKDFLDLTNKIVGCMKNAILWIATEFPRKNKPTYAKILVPNKEIYKFSKSELDDLNFLIKERIKREEKNNSYFYINEIKEDNDNTLSSSTLEKNDAIIFEKENDKAIEIYKKLVKLQPKNHEIWAFLGYLYYENEDFSKACENLEKALDLCPIEPFVLFLLGNIYSRKGEITKAVDCYEMAIFFDFDMYIAHIDFARKYEHMGRHKKALDEYKAAYDIDSRDEGLAEKIEYLENKYKKYLNDEKIS